MKKEKITIQNIPAILYGEAREQVFLFVHGKNGFKEEAGDFAEIACAAGWQVLGVDLPGHGERREKASEFTPWYVVPELESVMDYAAARWGKTALRATSIGTWFSMLAYAEKPLDRCLFVSPVLDMVCLIQNMMLWAGVTEERLQQEQSIETGFGETLSWEYLTYAREHAIEKWNAPTSILYAGNDEMTTRATVDEFTQRFQCRLTVMEEGEHWFHTPEQLAVLSRWTKDSFCHR